MPDPETRLYVPQEKPKSAMSTVSMSFAYYVGNRRQSGFGFLSPSEKYEKCGQFGFVIFALIEVAGRGITLCSSIAFSSSNIQFFLFFSDTFSANLYRLPVAFRKSLWLHRRVP